MPYSIINVLSLRYHLVLVLADYSHPLPFSVMVFYKSFMMCFNMTGLGELFLKLFSNKYFPKYSVARICDPGKRRPKKSNFF